MKKIVVIVGSASDLKQCRKGLEFLKSCLGVEVTSVLVSSQHRNTLQTQESLTRVVDEADVAIIGAGWANHLTGCCDAYLRYTLRTTKMPIIGVAFEDQANEKHTQAAILSITEVPGTQVIYREGNNSLTGQNTVFVGPLGFLRACQFAVSGILPEIKLPEPKEALDLTLDEAIEMAVKN